MYSALESVTILGRHRNYHEIIIIIIIIIINLTLNAHLLIIFGIEDIYSITN